ncbi:MAG: hypothetical protein ACTHMR_22870 [Thermomicrobiales bacterium]
MTNSRRSRLVSTAVDLGPRFVIRHSSFVIRLWGMRWNTISF